MILGFGDGGEQPHKPLTLVDGVAENAERFLSEHPETRIRLDSVTELIEGFETPFGVELLATVHWVAEEHINATEAEVVAYTHGWGDRKRQFSERQIGLALEVLKENGFIPQAEGEEISLAFHFARPKCRVEAAQRFEGM